ncbi:MAG: methyltransferase domain-containing protein [Firmicutes bacterium]|nr:methyltransferase domain-containing protein [Bacillota bacterium]
MPWVDLGTPEIHYEHLHRYYFASQFIEGKKVLDLAFGEGYGCAIMAEKAADVTGVELDEKAVKHASSRYPLPNVKFIKGSITEVPIRGEKIFDVITCFEAIEHIEEHEKLLAEVKRLLKEDGLFIISSPNKLTYSDETAYKNPYHVKELYFDEFRELLTKYFPYVFFLGQKVFPVSSIWPLGIGEGSLAEVCVRKVDTGFIRVGVQDKVPLYLIAIASEQQLPEGVRLSTLTDVSEELFGRLHRMIDEREHLLAEREQEFFIERETLRAQIAEKEQSILQLEKNLTNLKNLLSIKEKEFMQEKESQENQIAEKERTIAQLEENLSQLRRHLAERDIEIRLIYSSLGWRFIQQYRRIMDGIFPPLSSRRRFYELAQKALKIALTEGPFALGRKATRKVTRYFSAWHGRSQSVLANLKMGDAILVDIANVSPFTGIQPGRIAVHAHIFYPDLIEEIAKYLSNIPFTYDLFISVPDESAKFRCERILSSLRRINLLIVRIVENRGRDIAPMFCEFGSFLRCYDFIAHIHTKKSLYNSGATEGWREYLLEGLLGNEDKIKRIFFLLANSEKIGIVYPQNYYHVPYVANTWLANRSLGYAMCHRIGLVNIPDGYFHFPVGSMFWARVEALLPLFDAGITLYEFPEETGQTDGTLAHCLERMLGLSVCKAGYRLAVLLDHQFPSWSPWRFEQYLSRTIDDVQAKIATPEIRVIAFDIFDTLLVRPLLNPESIKKIVAHRIGGEVGKLYIHVRHKSEERAREHVGKDVGLDLIYKELADLTELPDPEVKRILELEKTIERAAVAPRPDIISIFNFAVSTGKCVVLISDMYLSKSTIESMLLAHGIAGWNDFYLSSEIGLRKDTGDLYRVLLNKEGVSPNEVLVIGDNERSDWQIPFDLGFQTLHVLRPVELARSLPRLGTLVEDTLRTNDLNGEIALGLIVKRNFTPLFYPKFDHTSLFLPNPEAIGYSVVGPVVLSFVQWLAEKATQSNIERLFFLSREGKLLKEVYDRWSQVITQPVPSEYLEVSRRAVTVPAIENLDDIYNIAKVTFFPNKLELFLFERYGLTLSQDDLSTLYNERLWSQNRFVEVIDGEINHLKPLLNALADRIISIANKERFAALMYFEQMRLGQEKSAVVDIGYSATVQGCLNRLLTKPINGYYLVTDVKSKNVCDRYGVFAEGYYGHQIDPFNNSLLLYRRSFELEKLLSSDSAQVINYKVDEMGSLQLNYKSLSTHELKSRSIRSAIQAGVMAYVEDAITVRRNLLPDFYVPSELAAKIYSAFVTNMSDEESKIINSLALDDHYCGRGVQ